MSTALSNNLEKSITLKDASLRLNVSIETLLSWNQHNILKPTITQEGEIGYTPEQIDQFLIIQKITTGDKITETKTDIIPQIQIKPVPTETNYEALRLTSLQNGLLPEDFAHFYRKSKSKSLKYLSPKLLLSFTAVVVVLTITVVTQQDNFKRLMTAPTQNTQARTTSDEQVLGSQTSKLKIPGQVISALPIELENEATLRKELQNIGEGAVKEKMTALALYKARSERIALSNRLSPTPTITVTFAAANRKPSVAIDENAVADTYASTVAFQDTCSTCTTDEDSAIDEKGNIRGEAKVDTLASIVGGIDQMVRGESLRQGNTDSTNQLIFLFISGLAAIFIFQKQLAYAAVKRTNPTAIDSYPANEDTSLQKVMEVDQKTDGTVVLYFRGKEFKVSKPELYSESDRFIEKLMELVEPDTKEIEYDMLKHENMQLITPLSRLVTRLGFVGIKRDLFFPRTSKSRVLFRRYLTQQDLNDMNLTTDEISNGLIMAS